MSVAPKANTDSKQREIYALVDALLGGAITEEQARRLDELVCNDADARCCYLQFISDSAMLREWSSAAAGCHGQLACPCDALADEQPAAPAAAAEPSVYPSHWLSSGQWHPMALLGSVPLGYAVATLILGIGIAAAWWGSTSNDGRHSAQVQANAGQTQKPAAGETPVPLAERKRNIIVGEITEMVDCRWADPGTAVRDTRGISLGQKFDLLSGRLLLSFDGGEAKIALEGPATLEVVGLRTGFLSFGRLTGRTIMVRAQGGSAFPADSASAPRAA